MTISTAAQPIRTRRAGRHAPVFLFAPARSYSTVSLALLAGHPALFGFPELLIFAHPTVASLLAERENRPEWPAGWVRGRLRGVCRAIAEVHDGDQSASAIRRAEEWLARRAGWTTVELLDHLLDGVAPRTGLEKSPDTSSSDASLAACLAAYPRARYLHLTRHPSDTQRSMREHWAWLHRGRPEVLTAVAATAWYRGHLRIKQALDALPPDRWLRVRAEDLLREPRIWLPVILGWLGLDASAATIDNMLHTDRWRFAGRDEAGRVGGGDPKFMWAPALRPVATPGPLGFDPALGLPAEMQRRINELARQLGYGPGEFRAPGR
jgi:hypothetical protein